MSAIPTFSSLQFLTYLRSFVQDIRQAQLLIVPSAENLSRTNKLIASLFGCVVLSASILRGQAGAKLSYTAGLRRKVRVFASDAFQQEAPSLTVWSFATFANDLTPIGKRCPFRMRDERMVGNGASSCGAQRKTCPRTTQIPRNCFV